MGKGDKKSRRGKLFMGSYGVRRPKNKSKNKKNVTIPVVTEIATPPAETRKPKKGSKK
jgi:30S ribosomal protein S31